MPEGYNQNFYCRSRRTVSITGGQELFDQTMGHANRDSSMKMRRAKDKPGPGSVKPVHLLSLPGELRQKVYESMKDMPPNDHLSFLRTCKMIWCEGRATLLSRPLVFNSQAQLIEFTGSVCDELLSKVVTIKLCLEDLDRSQVRQYLTEVAMGQSKKTSLQPYAKERDRITSALSMLPKLRSISLLRPSSVARNHAPKCLVNDLIDWIVKHLKNLRHLRIDYDSYAFEKLATLADLQTMQVSGFSRATAEQAERTAQNFTNLRELHVVPASYIMHTPYFKCQQPQNIISASLIHNLRPLQVLTLYEPPESPNGEHVFLTAPILKAISIRHSQTLEELNIRSLHALSPVTLKVTAALLLSTTALQSISLTFPQIPFDTIDALPRTTAELELLVSGPAEAGALLDRLSAQSYRLPFLKKVAFVVASTGPSKAAAGGSENATLPIQPLGGGTLATSGSSSSSPWAVRWGTWRPFADD